MGNCCESTLLYFEEIENHATIERNMSRQNNIEIKVKKILMLGSGSSGKSVLFKQLKCIHNNGFDAEELKNSRYIIRQNVVAGVMKLLKKSLELYESDNERFQDCFLDFTEDGIEDAVLCVVHHANDSFEEGALPTDPSILKKLGISIGILWDLKPIRRTYALRGDHFSLPDNMDFFLNISEIIFSEIYLPSDVHVLKTRIRTSGLIKVEYEMKDSIFHIYDVGGQRNERKKWIHSFENVAAVIFVAALNHYNAVLFEDEKKNAMHESLQLFDEICNSKWFRETEIIVFLTKNDLFIEKLREGHSLSKCFDPKVGWMGEIWEGPNYKMQEDINLDKEYFDHCYSEARHFIEDQYINQNRNSSRNVFTHVIQVTNVENVRQVFWDVQNIILRSNLMLTRKRMVH